MPNLDTVIKEIVESAASAIAKAVRDQIKADIERALGAPEKASKPSGRSAGRDKAPGAASRKAPAPKRGRGAGTRLSEAELGRVLDYITKNPGQRTEQIRAALKLDTVLGGKLLGKLRATGKVKTKGQKRTTTYSAA